MSAQILPKDLLVDLEKGDRTDEFLMVDETQNYSINGSTNRWWTGATFAIDPAQMQQMQSGLSNGDMLLQKKVYSAGSHPGETIVPKFGSIRFR